MYRNYSVLMSVYYKEQPEYLRLAIESMLNQTILTNDFILVCDGSLTPELDLVIGEYENKSANIFHVIRLEKNQGLGNALNIGLKACKNELIARMDSDDISLPRRCEIQLELFEKEPNLALTSGAIAEFIDVPEKVTSIRKLPILDGEIRKFAKRRNPMNHMAVMYRKSAVMESGNYQDMPLAEDYYLWVRMLQKGFKARNTEKVLVYARIGNGMYGRRGGLAYAKKIYKLQKSFLDMKFISKRLFLQNCFIRIISSIIPVSIRKFIYQRLLRRRL